MEQTFIDFPKDVYSESFSDSLFAELKNGKEAEIGIKIATPKDIGKISSLVGAILMKNDEQKAQFSFNISNRSNSLDQWKLTLTPGIKNLEIENLEEVDAPEYPHGLPENYIDNIMGKLGDRKSLLIRINRDGFELPAKIISVISGLITNDKIKDINFATQIIKEDSLKITGWKIILKLD